MKRFCIWLCLVLCGSLLLTADELHLGDGSILKGKIQEVHGGKVKLETGFAGVLSIDLDKVLKMTTDEPVMLADVLGRQGKKLVLKDQACKDVEALWRLEGVDPRLPKPPKPRTWSLEASIDLTGKTGNTEKCDFGGGLKATLAGPDDRLLLFGRGLYGKEDGVENDKELVLGADFERMFGKSDNSWYVRTQVEYDKQDNYERYYTSAFGYGYYICKNDFLLMRFRFGMTHLRKEYIDGMDTEDGLGVDFNYHHEINLASCFSKKDLGRLVTNVTYTPTFEAWTDDYRLYHESSWDIPLGLSGAWKIRLGVSNEYNNLVSGDTKRLDTSYFARLIFQWK